MENRTIKKKKEKVNFHIESDTLHRIRQVSEDRGMLLSEFFRQASEEKLKKEEKFMTIYVMTDSTGIQKITIERGLYHISLKDASKNMQDNVQAIQEGTLKPFSDEEWEEYHDNETAEGEVVPVLEYLMYIDQTIEKLLETRDEIYFFTKIKY